MVVGDFNGDGRPDLAVAGDVDFAGGYITLTVLINNTP
jgi:FG-GAP repeat